MFHYCWAVITQSQGLFCSTPISQGNGGHKEQGGDTAKTADPSWSKAYSIPHGIVISSAAGARRREEGEHTSRVTAFVFPSHHSMWWSCAVLAMAEHLPAHGNCWMNPLFGFAFLTKLSWSQPTGFLTSLPVLSPIPCEGRELCGAELLAGVKPHSENKYNWHFHMAIL